MPIVFSSPNIIPEKKPVDSTSSFNAMRQKAAQEQKSNFSSNNFKKPEIINNFQALLENKQAEEEIKAAKMKQTSKTGSTGVLKPKYLENKSVFYKESSYIKDLLGEGN